jgi:hypothetical protein
MADMNSTTGPTGANPHSEGGVPLLPGELPINVHDFVVERLRKARAIAVIAGAAFSNLEPGYMSDEALMLATEGSQRLLRQCRNYLIDDDYDESRGPLPDRALSGVWYDGLTEALGMVEVLCESFRGEGCITFAHDLMSEYLAAIEGSLDLALDDLGPGPGLAHLPPAVGVQ